MCTQWKKVQLLEKHITTLSFISISTLGLFFNASHKVRESLAKTICQSIQKLGVLGSTDIQFHETKKKKKKQSEY